MRVEHRIRCAQPALVSSLPRLFSLRWRGRHRDMERSGLVHGRHFSCNAKLNDVHSAFDTYDIICFQEAHCARGGHNTMDTRLSERFKAWWCPSPDCSLVRGTGILVSEVDVTLTTTIAIPKKTHSSSSLLYTTTSFVCCVTIVDVEVVVAATAALVVVEKKAGSGNLLNSSELGV